VSAAGKKSRIYAVGEAPPGSEERGAATPLTATPAPASSPALGDDGDGMGEGGGRDESRSSGTGTGGLGEVSGDNGVGSTEPKTQLRSAAARRWAAMGAELFADSDGPLVSSAWKQTLNGIALQR
jgi:hypothetical protein